MYSSYLPYDLFQEQIILKWSHEEVKYEIILGLLKKEWNDISRNTVCRWMNLNTPHEEKKMNINVNYSKTITHILTLIHTQQNWKTLNSKEKIDQTGTSETLHISLEAPFVKSKIDHNVSKNESCQWTSQIISKSDISTINLS